MANEDKSAGLKTLINAMKPIRFWLKPRLNHPPRPAPIVDDMETLDDLTVNGTDPFRRSAKVRMSLPIMQQSNLRRAHHQQPRPHQQQLNHLQLQNQLHQQQNQMHPQQNQMHQQQNQMHQQQNQMDQQQNQPHHQQYQRHLLQLHQQQQHQLSQLQEHHQFHPLQKQPTYQTLPVRSMGHIYLQHMGETKKANLPNEITSIDTIWALFVCAFPYMLTMDYMSQPHVKIYIYNSNCNIFYELHDIDDVGHESVLRIHQSDPQHYQAMRLQPIVPPPKPPRMIPVDLYYNAPMRATNVNSYNPNDSPPFINSK